jgi:predicted transcriptional regulator of viral defense system
MHKISYFEFKQSLVRSGKTYFTLQDLQKYYPHKKGSLKQLLVRWVQKGYMNALGRGYYTFDMTTLDYLRLACELVRPSYISFEYALYYHGCIDQIPQSVTLATQKRHTSIELPTVVLEYSHLKKELFFGFFLQKGVYIAEPEKALLDLLYLQARGKRLTTLDTLDKTKLSRKKLERYYKVFPSFFSIRSFSFSDATCSNN